MGKNNHSALIASALLAVSVVLTGCATTEADIRQEFAPLTGEQLSALITDNAIQWETDRSRGVAAYAADGSATVDWGTGDDVGTWRIDGDQLCSQWKTVRDGTERCFTVYQTGENQYRSFYDGKASATWKMVAKQ
ncbi:MAG: hypothetical protein AAF493_22170 [Pseudomonadota bacterium]